jgi:hypothetical protein
MQLKGKGKAVMKFGKKNQINLFIDCTHPVENGIMKCTSTGGDLGSSWPCPTST